MRRISVALFALMVAGLAAADDLLDTRVWTSSEGKSLRATLLRATPTSVSLKVAKTGKRVDIPLERLSEADRVGITAWLKSNPGGLVPPRPPFDWPDRFNGEQQPAVKYVTFDEKREVHIFSAKHFNLLCNTKLSASTVSKCAAVFDSIVGALDSLPLGLNPIPREGEKRYDALLLSSRSLYQQQGGPANSAGVYIPRRNLTMMPYSSLGIVKKGSNWVFDGSRREFGVLIHELTHQTLINRWGFLPVWFHEGIAEYMQAMPYRSGQFLFTNPGAGVSKHIRDGVGKLWKEFPCVHLESLLTIDLRTWNQINGTDRTRSWRNYASAELAIWYFMHVDGSGDGAHFIAWIHEMKTSSRSHKKNWIARKVELTRKHLLRDRSWEELEEEFRKALQGKGLRVIFAR
ncbi:MAG: hypothetical protein VCA38_19300 [Roseibacillus sp.]